MDADLLARDWLANGPSQAVMAVLCVVAAALSLRMYVKSLRLEGACADTLVGVVDDDGGGAAAETVVEQAYEARDGWADWREQQRRTQGRAFTLVTDDGRRVIVGGEGLRLWWPIEDTEHASVTRRRRVARVLPGRRVAVGGVRAPDARGDGPFRGGAQPAVPAGTPTLMEPALPALLRRQAGWLRRQTLLTLLVAGGFTALLTTRLVGGHRVAGEVVAVEGHGNGEATLVVRAPSGVLRAEVWSEHVRPVGARVGLREGPWPTALRLGGEPALPVGWAVAAGGLTLALALAAFLADVRLRRQRWWELPSLDERAAPP